jgi:hypothetical protein
MPILTLVVAATLALAGACAAGTGFADDQPTDQGALEPGELDALPVPGGAAPFTEPAQKHGNVTQSFKVTGWSPADVLHFYTGALPSQGWSPSSPPGEDGDVWRGEWARGDRLLVVTAEPDVDDGTGDGSGAATSQLDLDLHAVP